MMCRLICHLEMMYVYLQHQGRTYSYRGPCSEKNVGPYYMNTPPPTDFCRGPVLQCTLLLALHWK